MFGSGLVGSAELAVSIGFESCAELAVLAKLAVLAISARLDEGFLGPWS